MFYRFSESPARNCGPHVAGIVCQHHRKALVVGGCENGCPAEPRMACDGYFAGVYLFQAFEQIENPRVPPCPRDGSGPVGKSGFFVKHFIKDLKIALEEADKLGVDLPGTKLAKDLYERLAGKGFEDAGTQALIKLWWEA